VKAGGQRLIILLDEGTPILAAAPFLERGHKAIYHSDVLVSGAKDELVVATAILNKAALIAVDLDMKRMARRFGSPGNGEKYHALNLILSAATKHWRRNVSTTQCHS
jgi:predicted nuclease of predicted toxin-antitoxin system